MNESKNSIFNPLGNSEYGKGWLVKSTFLGDSSIALTFAESEYFKTKLFVTPTGILFSLFISKTSLKLFSHDKNEIAIMKRKFFKNYNDGTVTDKPIQHLKDITAPALPSVKMSVLVGALPS